jgi:hypothetical protein
VNDILVLEFDIINILKFPIKNISYRRKSSDESEGGNRVLLGFIVSEGLS